MDVESNEIEKLLVAHLGEQRLGAIDDVACRDSSFRRSSHRFSPRLFHDRRTYVPGHSAFVQFGMPDQ